MIKILFSPSESKSAGGEAGEYCDFLFPELFKYRQEIVTKYEEFVKTASIKELERLFGVKDIENYKEPISGAPLKKAVERYSGVAYEYLKYETLEKRCQKYVDENTIIFSNLYGPLLASDKIPNYKLKQGESFGGLKIEEHYRKHFSDALDKYLADSFVLDLRAGFYEKFYKPKDEHMTLKFLKDAKVVSHYAKAYRGLVLRECALHGVTSKDEFLSLNLPSLKIVDMKKIKNRTEITFEIAF